MGRREGPRYCSSAPTPRPGPRGQCPLLFCGATVRGLQRRLQRGLQRGLQRRLQLGVSVSTSRAGDACLTLSPCAHQGMACVAWAE